MALKEKYDLWIKITGVSPEEEITYMTNDSFMVKYHKK